jgi:hypothetical protein
VCCSCLGEPVTDIYMILGGAVLCESDGQSEGATMREGMHFGGGGGGVMANVPKKGRRRPKHLAVTGASTY